MGSILWVPGFEGRYEVSDDGIVYSHMNMGNHKWQVDYRRPLSLKPNKYGYVVINLLAKDGLINPRSVHSMVMQAFVGQRPKGMDIRHMNGVRHDNRLINLRYGSRAENMADAKSHGTMRIEEKHHAVKVTREDAIKIIARCRSGEVQRSIALDYGLTQQGVSDILNGRCWKSLDSYRV